MRTSRKCWRASLGYAIAFAPLLDRALRRKGPIDLKLMVAEALRRGDECHNRNKAATAMFFREIASALVGTEAPHADIGRALDFISGNDHFFLSLSIAHAKAVTLAMENLGIGSLVTTMAGNGREVGIRTSRTGKALVHGAGRGRGASPLRGPLALEDATPTMGDSYVTEVIGLGGFALAAAPAIAEFIGGKASDLAARSEAMRKIAVGSIPNFAFPHSISTEFHPGIDVFKVAANWHHAHSSTQASRRSARASGRSAPARRASRSPVSPLRPLPIR